MEALTQTLSLFTLLMVFALLASLAARGAQGRFGEIVSTNLGALVQLCLGLGVLALVTYITLYFLALVGGFYESLTCKVVTLPACEDPLSLPVWLRLPEQSVGGVIGILPLLAVFLAKVLQPPLPALHIHQAAPWYAQLGQRLAHVVVHNFGVLVILGIELWLAGLRGAAEAADREVRLALGLDSELPASYLDIAQWGAVVLALGLSAVVIYLGIVGRYGKVLMVRALVALDYGAGLVTLLGSFLSMVVSGLVRVWTVLAIALGRLALKAQHMLYHLWAVIMTAVGRLLLKTQSFLYRSWAFLASTLGWTVIWLGRIGRSRRSAEVLALVALSGGGLSYATTYIVLLDATGSEAQRLDDSKQTVLSWADPSPQRALLERGDRLIVIPIRAPGNLNTTYSALFNATYPSNQLERYEFFATLRDTLPERVDEAPGTGLSASLRAAVSYTENLTEQLVLIVFGNGEDHSADPISAAELAPMLEGAVVVHLNMGLEQRDLWSARYRQAGAKGLFLYDLAATRSLRSAELQAALEQALNE